MPRSQTTNNLSNDRLGPDRTTRRAGRQSDSVQRAWGDRHDSSWSEIEFHFGRQLYLPTWAEILGVWGDERERKGEAVVCGCCDNQLTVASALSRHAAFSPQPHISVVGPTCSRQRGEMRT